jgi:hypothetical protein
LRKCFTPQTAVTASGTVKTLFAIRARVGALFGWDDARERWDQESYRHRLTDEDRARSLVAPGSDDGLFKVVYVFANESVSEIRNATVHAFSCMSLRETMQGYRLYWGIYVKPISPWTGTYMRIIDPFRRAIVYPAVLNRISVEWGIRFCD